MKRIIHFILPKEKKLFEMLAQESGIALQSANELGVFLGGYEKLERSSRKANAISIKRLKHNVGELKRSINSRLGSSFSTQIGKEHIYKIASLLEEISGLISDVALGFVALGIERIDISITKLVYAMCSALDELNKSIANLRKFKSLKEHCEKVYSLENEADEIYHEALSELFHFYKNSIDIIKYKEIYGLLKQSINKCRDIADVMERISAKHS